MLRTILTKPPIKRFYDYLDNLSRTKCFWSIPNHKFSFTTRNSKSYHDRSISLEYKLIMFCKSLSLTLSHLIFDVWPPYTSNSHLFFVTLKIGLWWVVVDKCRSLLFRSSSVQWSLTVIVSECSLRYRFHLRQSQSTINPFYTQLENFNYRNRHSLTDVY